VCHKWVSVLAIFHSARLLLGLPSVAMLCVPQSFSGFCPSTLRMRNACEVSSTTAFAPTFAVFYGILLDVAGPNC